jgi:hypothetical protein
LDVVWEIWKIVDGGLGFLEWFKVVGFYQSDYGVWMELEVEFNYVVSCEMI